jgi:hypothetical protein
VSTASLVLLIVSSVLTLFGLPCCLGWLNWFAVPISFATAMVGFAGLLTDRDPVTGQVRSAGIHIMALVGGWVLVVAGALRCLLGAGVV